MRNTAESVLAKLKNESKKKGISFQQLLNLFCQEEFVRRLSRSKYKNKMILKGGFLLYAISKFTTRPTIDADYLLKNYSNDTTALEKCIREIISIDNQNEFIKMEIRSLKTIGLLREYEGVRVNLIGIIGM